MTHTLPQLLPECKQAARQFCGACRRKQEGRPFRQTILRIRGIEGVACDFDCPRGLRWRRRWHVGPGDALHYAGIAFFGIGPMYERWRAGQGRPCRCRDRRKWLNSMGWSGAFRALARPVSSRITPTPKAPR